MKPTERNSGSSRRPPNDDSASPGDDFRTELDAHDDRENRTRTQRIKGRGALSNADSRYLQRQVSRTAEDADDGWQLPSNANRVEDQTDLAHVFNEPAQPKTQVFRDRTQKIIATNASPDINFDQSINPYKGCEHGCIYCYARPTHAYLDLSPGLDFETKIFYKSNVRERLLEEVGRPSYVCKLLAMGTNTDPYQPLEKRLQVTREVLTTLLELRHPVSIVTKSALILRDIDLLQEFAEQELVNVFVSVTTLDRQLKTQLEPRTADPSARLRVVSTLAEAGVPVGVLFAPVIPFLNDQEIEAVVERCAGAGAGMLRYILLRLPLEVKPLFEEWLQTHYPLRAERIMGAIRDARGGKAYRAQWHKRMTGEGPVASIISQRFKSAVKKAGLHGKTLPTPRTDLFAPPNEQMQLF